MAELNKEINEVIWRPVTRLEQFEVEEALLNHKKTAKKEEPKMFANNTSEKTCENCDKTFVGSPRAKRCPDCRHEANKAQQKEKYTRKTGRLPQRNDGHKKESALKLDGGKDVTISVKSTKASDFSAKPDYASVIADLEAKKALIEGAIEVLKVMAE